MRGAFYKLLWYWPVNISHNDRNIEEKKKRYEIGQSRMKFLQKNLEPFAYGNTDDSQIVALVNELDKFDRDFRIPENFNIEYVAGKITSNQECVVFAYIWFESIQAAKSYAEMHQMKVLGGW